MKRKRKKLLSIVLIISMVIGMWPVTERNVAASEAAREIELTNQSPENAQEQFAEFAGGDGSEENPYQISSSEMFREMAEYPGKNFVLISDLNLSASPRINFEGRFDGNGYTIEIDFSEENGMFNQLGEASVITDCNIDIGNNNLSTLPSGMSKFGAVALSNLGLIKRCVVKGSVLTSTYTDSLQVIGSICAANGGSIEKCRNDADYSILVAPVAHEVALLGICSGTGTVTQCLNTGNLIAGVMRQIPNSGVFYNYVAGINRFASKQDISECANIGNITLNFYSELTGSSAAHNYAGFITDDEFDAYGSVVPKSMSGIESCYIGENVKFSFSTYNLGSGGGVNSKSTVLYADNVTGTQVKTEEEILEWWDSVLADDEDDGGETWVPDGAFSISKSGAWVSGKECALYGSYSASTPGNARAEAEEIVWSSSDPSILDVSDAIIDFNIADAENNHVSIQKSFTAQKAGTVTITATAPDGRSESITVDVEPELVVVGTKDIIVDEIDGEKIAKLKIELFRMSLESEDEEYLKKVISNMEISSENISKFEDISYEISDNGMLATVTAITSIPNDSLSINVISKAGQDATININTHLDNHAESVSPEYNYQAVGLSSLPCTITYDAKLSSTVSDKAYLVTADGDKVVEEIKAPDLVASDKQAYFKFNFNKTLLKSSSKYYILFDDNTFKLEEGTTGLAGIANKKEWAFQTVDLEYPLISNLDASVEIPDEIYRILYPPTQAEKIKKKDDGTAGLCYGFCYAVAAWNDGYTEIHKIGSEVDNMMQLELDTTGNSNYSFLEYLQLAQIYQQHNIAMKQSHKNPDLDEVYNAIVRYVNKDGAPVVLKLFDGASGHAILPIGIFSDNEDCTEFIVYNCIGKIDISNAGEYLDKLTFFKEDGKIVSWEFKDGTSSYDDLRYYCVIDTSFEEMISSSDIDVNNMIFSTTELAGMQETNTVSNSEERNEIKENLYLYWYDDASYTRRVIENSDTAEIGMTDGYKEISVDAPLCSDVTLDLDNKKVILKSSELLDYSITFRQTDEDDNFSAIRISGNNYGLLSSSETNDGILIEGNDMKKVTVTASFNETITNQLEFSTSKKSALISETDHGLMVLIDTDDDGIYETEVNEIEEHVHVYTEPEFNWSIDYQECTADFTCTICGDKQTVKCEVTGETTDPTCTEAGKTVYTATVSFEGKEYADTQEEVIPATGHTYEYTDNGDGTHTKVCTAGDETATEPHTYQDGICTFCGAEEPKEHVHEYGTPEFNWSEDYATCTMVFTCKDGDDQQNIECEVTDEITDATCTENGKAVYTAKGTFDGKEYTDVKEVEISASGHAYGTPEFNWSDDYTTCTAVFTCESCNDEQKLECDITSETTDPTCTGDGKTVYTATASFADTEYTDTQEKVISATGHTYEYTDNGDGTHTKVCTAGDDTTAEPHTYQDGTCTYCGAEEPKEHIHEYGTPEFKWSEDYTTCTAVFTCKDGDNQQSIECEVTDEVTDATCTENGKAIYTAKVTFGDKEYTDVKEQEIPASGHTYGTPEFNWSEDYQTCTAVFTCESCDDEQKMECDIVSETTDPTCTEDGKTVYTATVAFEGKEYTDTQEGAIPAAGHTYEYTDNGDGTHTKVCTAGDDRAIERHIYQDGICTSCGAEEPEEHEHVYGEPDFTWSEDYQTCTAIFTCKNGDDEQKVECKVTSETTDPTCTESGKTVYTAAVQFGDQEYTNTKEEAIPAVGHNYEYTDNGDGTHTKACTAGDESTTEPHVYKDGKCTCCGAKEPEEHEHVYGEPEFTWSEDNQTCTAIFTCKNGDDEQKVECKVTSESTDPTCTEAGKTVYTATALFGDQEYTDTKEEEIPAAGHSYEYTDNGDGTHTKVCTAGDDTAAEPHTYQDGICVYCGAEEPEGHVHEYGEPEFIWSDDCKNCTIVFTCADGDDQQKIECEVTSEITDATCTENGKAVYTAKGSFNGEEYSDMKEEEIPASGHAYGEPVFSWSEDYQTCTAVFTCESGDDEQSLECEVVSETTEPTCTASGKTVYTATVLFNDKEYSDTQEETIVAAGHTYEYRANGDGTHTKTCTVGDDSKTESHTYQDGICAYCGAEEPKEHVHEYGEPEFSWADDFRSCTAAFTCTDNDDQQTVECTVESKDNGDGTVTYTAVAEFNETSYTDTQTVKIPEKSEGTDNIETPTGTGEENKTNKPTAGTANASSNKTNNKTATKATADDKVVSSAKTGDDTNAALWILLLAAAGATGVMIVRSKKKMK